MVKVMKRTIQASEVVIRKMSGRKCDKMHSGLCPIMKDQITKEMIDLPYWDDSGVYIPEDFCRGLAAKYLFSEFEREQLFAGFKCVRYKCGHIRMRSDMNHRMCILAHLNELVEVELTESADLCTNCENQKMHLKSFN